MGELGSDALELHRQIGGFAAQRGIDLLLVVGALASEAASEFKRQGGKSEVFKDNQSLAAWLKGRVNQEMVVLVKGSRSAAMETVVSALTASTSKTGDLTAQVLTNKDSSTEGKC